MDHAGIEQDRRELEWYRKHSNKHPPSQREVVLSPDSTMTIEQVAKDAASVLIQSIRTQAEEIKRKRKGKK